LTCRLDKIKSISPHFSAETQRIGRVRQRNNWQRNNWQRNNWQRNNWQRNN